jgi:hypothetical protein
VITYGTDPSRDLGFEVRQHHWPVPDDALIGVAGGEKATSVRNSPALAEKIIPGDGDRLDLVA